MTETPILEATEAPSVAGVPTSRLYRAQFVATARLQLYFTAETHTLFAAFAEEAMAIILRHADKDGKLDTVSGYNAQQKLTGIWGDMLMEWVKLFQKAREVAATLPFGGLCEFHERLVSGQQSAISENGPSTALAEARSAQGVFDPQIQVLLNAAAEYLYGDGMNLSGRIWRLDRDARDGMNTLISAAVADGSSAWDLARNLEQFLGADADCPRWTSTRLYKRSKSQIAAGDMTGLITNPNCGGQGVSYNALRLARIEIQKAHALATDKVLLNSPWVEKEQVNLSAQHPEPDICDDVVNAGEKGEPPNGGAGVYEKGEIELPLHLTCLCYKTAVLMDEDEFIGDLNAWVKGDSEWQAMDKYAELLGVRGGEVSSVKLSSDPSWLMLGVWLFGEVLKL